MYRVLLADDEQIERMALAKRLKRHFCGSLDISEAVNGAEALEISMQDAARMMNYSDAYFCKLFKQCFDQNFTSYLTGFRVNEAKKLLKDRSISVKDVSMQVGYYDSNYFAKVFKRITGMIPSEYRDSETAQK